MRECRCACEKIDADIERMARWYPTTREIRVGESLVCVCGCSMNTLYLLVEETEIVRLVGGTYTSYSQGKAERKNSFSAEGVTW